MIRHLQRYYYDYYNIEYSFMSVEYVNGKYQFTEYKIISKLNKNYNELIHILDFFTNEYGDTIKE